MTALSLELIQLLAILANAGGFVGLWYLFATSEVRA